MDKIVSQFVIVAFITAIAPVGLVLAASLWPDPAAEIPSHWDVVGQPALEKSWVVFLISIVPAVLCCAVAIVAAALLRADVGRWSTASGLGALTLAGAFSGLIWVVGQLTVSIGTQGNRIGPSFVLFLIPVMLAAVSFAVAASRSPRPAANALGD